MKLQHEEALAFGGVVVAATYLIGMFVLCLWQSVDAVGVVVIGMGGVSVLVLVSCELNEQSSREE
jgi:hypothetical protein